MLHKVYYHVEDTIELQNDIDYPLPPGTIDWISDSGVPREQYLHFYAVTEESRVAAQTWHPRPTDIIVATHSKSGTTLLQNMLQVSVVINGTCVCVCGVDDMCDHEM